MSDYEHQKAAFLFDGARTVEERKRRLETAWDIMRIVEDIMLKQGRKAHDRFEQRLEEAFEGYHHGTRMDVEEMKEEHIFYKPAWLWDERGCVLSYSCQKNLYGFEQVGIRKYGDLAGIPFGGDGVHATLSPKMRQIHTNLFASVEMLQARWEKNEAFNRLGLIDYVWIGSKENPGKLEEELIAGISLSGSCNTVLRMMLVKEGIEAVVDDSVKCLQEFRACTEAFIDAFVEEYRKGIAM